MQGLMYMPWQRCRLPPQWSTNHSSSVVFLKMSKLPLEAINPTATGIQMLQVLNKINTFQQFQSKPKCKMLIQIMLLQNWVVQCI
jgi:hypothetical protein